MTEFTTDEERDNYLINQCTPWGEDGCFKFLHEDVPGLFNKEPVYSGKHWAIKIISEEQDWTSSSRPDCFPLNCVGSYRYLIKPTAFDFDEETYCITRDLLYPWDKIGNPTRWYYVETEKGTVRQAVSKHAKYRNIRRYISYYTDQQHRPLSNVLYQYIVLPRKQRRPKKESSPQVQAQKRKSEFMQKPFNLEELARNVQKRLKTERLRDSQFQEASCSRRTPSQRKGKEEKPMKPSPPGSVTSYINAINYVMQHQNKDPVFIDLEDAHSDLQKVVVETKSQYCALTNPTEMTAMNDKLIRLVRLQSELEAEVVRLAEHVKTKTEEIMATPAPVPVNQDPMPVIIDNSDSDAVQACLPMKIESIELE